MSQINARVRHKRDTSSNWTTKNPVLLDGELIIVDTDSGEVRFKIGDGVKTYTQLPFQDEIIRGLISDNATDIGELETAVSNRVEKVTGKGLSTNDYTTAEKNKLAGIATGANKYTHPTTSGNKHIPSGGSSGQILRWSADGTAAWGADNNTTYSAATTSAAGLMSAADKSKANYTNIAYGTCSTAAATGAKEVTIVGNTNWSLTAGSIIAVNITNTNTATSDVTLNVNETGAKPIYYNKTQVGSSYYSSSLTSGLNLYVYDGTGYVWMGHSTDSNTTYTNASLGQGYGTCATAAATTAKVVTLSSYSLVKGGIVSVKFTYDVPASATMNINSKGAKAIYHNGAAIKAGVIKAGDIATFVYDGTQYQLIAVDRTHIDYTATISTTWTGSAAPYSQDITITGITANDKPIVDVTMSGTFATDQTRLAEWGKIYRIVTAANKITVYATEKTTASLPIQLQVVR